MSFTPRYSIILPVRNGGAYVKECINSVLAQSLCDFNLHVLDNYSNDGTGEWVRSLKDERIIYLPSERSLTIEENWFRISTIQKNEFITLIGHDDVLEKNYLEVIDNLRIKHPGASLYQTHFRYIDADGELVRRCRPMPERLLPEDLLAFLLCRMIDTVGTGFIMRATHYDKIGGIPMYPNLLFADFELWHRLTKPSYLAVSPEECFAFRLHQSTTTTSSDIKFQEAFSRLIDYLANEKKDPLSNTVIEKYAVDFIDFYTKAQAHRLLRTPASKREGRTVKYIGKQGKLYAGKLVPGNTFDPYNNFSFRLAAFIDSNPVTRAMFLGFKKVWKKPVLE
jgi:glycosyltransferase involved in cell wall biosynthesis